MNFALIEHFAVIVLTFSVGILMYSYSCLLREFKKYETERELIENEARLKAIEIVEEAKNRALEIVDHYRIVADKKKEEMEQRLERISERQLINYKDTIHNMSKALENDAMREIGEFRKSMEVSTLGVQEVVKNKVDEQYRQMTEDLESHRRVRIGAIDAEVMEAVRRLSKLVLGKIIKSGEQERLVIQALEEAKKAHVV